MQAPIPLAGRAGGAELAQLAGQLAASSAELIVVANHKEAHMDFKMTVKYHQMKRSHEKLRIIGTDAGNRISNVDGRESAEEFFTQCYHFKDWLIKEHPRLRTAAEDHITATKELAIAADICNSFKHAGLDRPSRSGQPLNRVSERTRLDLTPQGFRASAQVEIQVGAQSYLSLDLATKCMDAWDDFLHTHNIVIPPP